MMAVVPFCEDVGMDVSGESDDNTIRQRRKRRIDDVRKVLVEAYRSTQVEVDDG